MFRYVVLLRCGILAFSFLLSLDARSAEPIWIDTDISIGSPFREVDDAFALIAALHSPRCRIIGISTSYGNASRQFADRAASDVVGRFGTLGQISKANIYSGADRAKDLGLETPATIALAHALIQRRLTYLAIGPLTNLATLIRIHPNLTPRVKQIVFVSGTFPGERLTLGRNEALQFHDANTLKDPEAVAEILRTEIPVFLVPVGVAQALTITRDELGWLGEGSESGRYLASRGQAWMWFWRNIGRASGAPLFDLAGALTVLQPNLLTSAPRYARVEVDGRLMIRGIRLSEKDKPVKCCLSIKPSAMGFFLRTLQGR